MPSNPLYLAIDCSTACCAVAISSGENLLVSVREELSKGQSERLFGMIEEVLNQANVNKNELSKIIVSTGPGNFTGIRVGISAARGLAMALSIPAVGVTRHQALAKKYQNDILTVLNSKKNYYFVQRFNGSPLGDICVMSFDEIISHPWNKMLLCVGDDADIIGNMIGCEFDATADIIQPQDYIAAFCETNESGPPIATYVRAADALPSKIASAIKHL